MLDSTSTIHFVPQGIDAVTGGPPLQCRPIRHLAARNLAKAERSIEERAYLATLWLKNLLDIDRRTGALASAIFEISSATISRALAEDRATTVELLAHHWRHASIEERAAFGRVIGVDCVWDCAIAPNV